MFLTTRGRYAVTAVIDIISYGSNLQPVSLAQISARQCISISYLEQIFLMLKKYDIVRSVKGPGGGYVIAKNPHEITLAEVLNASGESIKMTKCEGKTSCNGTNERCRTHHIWEAFEERIVNYLNSITIADVVNNPKLST